MMSEWKSLKLSDIAYLSSDKIEMQDVGLNNYISTDNMLPDKSGVEPAIKLPSAKRVSHFEKGDILFSNIRPYFKKVWLAEFEGGASADVLVWKPLDKELVTKEYLYYLLSSDEFIEYSVRTSKGVKMPRGDKEAMLSYELILPPIEVQRDIALLGRRLDHKITNNTTMNATLEKIAQRIFKSWFVDFDPVKANAEGVPFDGLSPEIQALFPNELEESELGMIPKGWEVKKVTDLANVSSGKRPIVKVDSKNKEMTVPVYGGNGIKWYSNQTNMESQFIITGRVGTLGTVFKVFNPCWVSDNALTIIPKEKCDFEFAYQALNLFDIQSLNSGSTQPLVTQTAIKNIPLIFPTNHILREKYNDFATGINRKIQLNNEQNQTLSDIRDKLLPRLISGKITIQKAEELLEEAS